MGPERVTSLLKDTAVKPNSSHTSILNKKKPKILFFYISVVFLLERKFFYLIFNLFHVSNYNP